MYVFCFSVGYSLYLNYSNMHTFLFDRSIFPELVQITPIPIFVADWMPILSPNQQHESTEGCIPTLCTCLIGSSLVQRQYGEQNL